MQLDTKVEFVLSTLLACVAIVGCAARTTSEHQVVPTGAPDAFPETVYLDAIARGDSVYEVDESRSLIRVFAYRARCRAWGTITLWRLGNLR